MKKLFKTHRFCWNCKYELRKSILLHAWNFIPKNWLQFSSFRPDTRAQT